ncbi:MAG: glycosyltransferase family 9 protein, partial [Candidatus Eremiobacteraeota bacterium]|nr:glycosyltransferase family 9 protein [Candidatus Eremiobacteraeota bacterium]
MKPLPLEQFERVLVVRTDHIGDLVLSTPFLRALRDGLPSAHITALVAPYTRAVLASSGLVDRILTESPEEDFQLAVCLAPRTHSYKLTYASGAAYRVGYYYAGRPLVAVATRLWLTHRARVVVDPQGVVAHEIDQLACLADLLGLDYQRRELELGIERPEVGERLVLHLGTRWFTGEWRVSHLAELAGQLGSVTVTHGPAEEAQAAELKALMPDLEVVGGLSFTEWATTLGAARAVISCDTGAVHVAAAMGRPVVVAYEP